MKVAVIVNPVAGAGRSGGRWADLHEAFLSVFGDFELKKTGCPGHAVELTQELLMDGFERIIAVGGDGTWHEVAEGYLSLEESLRGEAVLGCFPTGSGCDFARHMGLPADTDDLLKILSGDKRAQVDVVRAQVTDPEGKPLTVHLTNMAAFGLGGDVAWVVEKTGKPFGGTASYLLVTLGLLMRSKAREFELILDGKPLDEKKFHTVLLANTSTTGGGMKVAPEADTTDGLFEIVTFGDMSRWEMARRFPLLYKGTHIGHTGIGLYRAKKLEARVLGPEPARLNIDGEALGTLPASFEVLPAALPVLVP